MSRMFKTAYLYTRLCGIVVFVLVVLILLFKNLGRTANVWFWTEREVDTVWLVVATGAISILLFWAASSVRRVISDLRKHMVVQRQEAAKRQADESMDAPRPAGFSALHRPSGKDGS